MKSFLSILFLIVLQNLSFSPSTTTAVQYIVINDAKNTEGGARFEAQLGVIYTKLLMKKITLFIWNVFHQYNPSQRKPVEIVTMYIEKYHSDFEAVTYGEARHKHINISATYLKEYTGNLRWEFTSLLYHEMTHAFQWFGDTGNSPINLIEGIADYMILKSNYYPSTFAKPGHGDKWDQGYDVTARFLEYCENLRPGFVAGLNRMMKDSYSDDYFLKLTGKSVDQLWTRYKAKYGRS